MPEQPPPARGFADLTDPAAVRLSRRVLQGHIHMLEAQIAQLSEVVRTLRERESELSPADHGSGGSNKGGSDDHTAS